MENKLELVIHDMLILSEYCNLECGYCEGFYPTDFKFRPNQEGQLLMPQHWVKSRNADKELTKRIPSSPTVNDFFRLGKDVLERVAERVYTPVLKLSGGEIFLSNDVPGFVKQIHNNYSTVQLLTNGLGITEDAVDRFADMGNICFQISLDGHTASTNYARSEKENVANAILKTIDNLQTKGVCVEINCVLTKHNTTNFGEFARYFSNRYEDVILLPRPVRGGPKSILEATPDQIKSFAEVRGNYDKYANVLPPIAYLDRVVSVLENGTRSWNCWVPMFVFGTDNYGTIQTCTCAGDLPKLGKILDHDERGLNLIRNDKHYDPQSKPKPCADCITQYEMFDLFMEGLVTDNELQRLPSLRSPEAIGLTRRIKNRLSFSGTPS